MELQKIFTNLSQASVLIPVLTGLIYYKALTKPFKVLFYFFIAIILFEIQSLVAIEKYHNNMPGQHTYTLVEFLVFSAVYYFHMKNSLMRGLIVINAVIFTVIAIGGALIYGVTTTNDISRGYSSISLILYSLGYFYHLFMADDTRYMWEYPMFWFCTATLVGISVAALYAMAKGYLLVSAPETEKIGRVVYDALNIVVSCLYAQTFRCLRKQKKQLG